MDEVTHGIRLHFPEKQNPVRGRGAGLVYEGLAKRVVAAAAGDLSGRVGDVLAEVSGKGIGELFEGDFGLAGRRDLQKRLREGELIGRDISAE